MEFKVGELVEVSMDYGNFHSMYLAKVARIEATIIVLDNGEQFSKIYGHHKVGPNHGSYNEYIRPA